MKKNVLTLSIILCLLFLSPLKNYKISVRASSRTLTVGNGPGDFRSIQEAINNASSGDTIFVRNGTYYETIVINKTIILMGENRDSTIINGNKTDHVVTMKAEYASLQGFTIMKSANLPKSGIFVNSSSMGNIITNNRIIENSYGICLYSCSNNIVSGNIISNNTYGISLYSCSNNIVSGNIISNNTYGISLISCSDNLIFGNTILSNVRDGIYFQNSFNNFISDNIILSNTFNGISLSASRDNIIYRNTLSSNLYGILLYSSLSNVIKANTIINHSFEGIVIAFSSYNIIYHNNFNNTIQVWSSDSTNFWSCNGEGNYWSDYKGRDFYSGPNQDNPGSDGIGDIPYVIDETNQTDNSPLMGMFSEFNIAYKGETYNVTIISNSTIFDFQFQIGIETGNKIISFKPSGNQTTVGFCRVTIPTKFMSYPYILLLGNEEINPVFLDISNETHIYLYFEYLHKNHSVTIISSELYSKLLGSCHDLNATYYNLLNIYNALLSNYTLLLGNYTQLQKSFEQLNASYQYFYDLNVTYYNLLNTLVLLLGNYTQLQEDYQELNASYQEHLLSYSENVSNIQNLTYILAATIAILIIITTYLSKRTHGGVTRKIKMFEEK